MRTLSGAPRDLHTHAVAFYDADADLLGVLARYLARGLDEGEHVVLVADPVHRAALVTMLRRQGLDFTGSWGGRRFVELDAAQSLARIQVDGRIDRDAFLATVRPVIEEGLAAGRRVRVYGEMVALLWARGDVVAALELERHWNELRKTLEFSLLCGYRADQLGIATLSQVGDTCDLHSDVRAPASYTTWSAEPLVDARRDLDRVTDSEVVRSDVLLPLPAAVPAARRFVRRTLASWGEPVGDAALVVSELATNAVVHGHSPFRATVSRQGDALRVAVEDAGPGWPGNPPSSAAEDGGRGLALVEALTRRTGCDPSPEGKEVWAELPSPPGTAPTNRTDSGATSDS